MGHHKAADAAVRLHSTTLGEPDADVGEMQDVVEQEVKTRIGQRWIAYGRSYPLKLLGMNLLHGEVLILGISPIVFPHLLMHFLGCRLGKAVGYQLHHHALVVVVGEVGFKPYVNSGGKNAHRVGNTLFYRTQKIGKAKVGHAIGNSFLLPEHRQTVTFEKDIVAIAVGIANSEQSVSGITVVNQPDTFFCLDSQQLLFVFVLHLPSMIEIRPVDIRCHVAWAVCQLVSFHSYSLNLTSSAAVVSTILPSA